MKLQIISKEIALELKELGFDWECCNIYRKSRAYHICTPDNINSTRKSVISAPTQALVCKWFRDVHGIKIVIVPSFNCYQISQISQYNKEEVNNDDIFLDGLEFKDFESYEEAEEAIIIKSIEILKNGR